MTGDCHVPFCGSPGVRSPRATRRPSGYVQVAMVQTAVGVGLGWMVFGR